VEKIQKKNPINDENKNSKKPKDRKAMFIALGLVVLLIPVLILLGVPKEIVAFITVILAFFTKAFAGLVVLISMVPIIGPLIVKVLSIPFFWLVNALGYFISVLAIKKGYTKQVVGSRVLTLAVLVGIVLGYILGHLLPLY